MLLKELVTDNDEITLKSAFDAVSPYICKSMDDGVVHHDTFIKVYEILKEIVVDSIIVFRNEHGPLLKVAKSFGTLKPIQTNDHPDSGYHCHDSFFLYLNDIEGRYYYLSDESLVQLGTFTKYLISQLNKHGIDNKELLADCSDEQLEPVADNDLDGSNEHFISDGQENQPEIILVAAKEQSPNISTDTQNDEQQQETFTSEETPVESQQKSIGNDNKRNTLEPEQTATESGSAVDTTEVDGQSDVNMVHDPERKRLLGELKLKSINTNDFPDGLLNDDFNKLIELLTYKETTHPPLKSKFARLLKQQVQSINYMLSLIYAGCECRHDELAKHAEVNIQRWNVTYPSKELSIDMIRPLAMQLVPPERRYQKEKYDPDFCLCKIHKNV